jgi:hypothetical protein
VIDGDQGIRVYWTHVGQQEKLREGISERPDARERFASVQLMSIIRRVQSSTEKKVSCPALVEKRERAAVAKTYRAFRAFGAPAAGCRRSRFRVCEFFWPSELDLRRLMLIVLRPAICERLDA